MQNKEFTGVWIPKHIIEDEELSMTDKIIYSEIACFEVCYKSNQQLGERYKLKANTIMKIVGKLVEKGYVERLSFDGRNRQLKALRDKPNHMQHVKKITPCIGKKSHPACEKNHTKEYNKENIEEKREPPHAHIRYLTDIPKQDIIELQSKIKATEQEIRDKGESLYDYCKAKGKKYKNYKSFLRNALKQDFKLKQNYEFTGPYY